MEKHVNTEAMIQPTITFLNSSGDITISWEKDKEEEMLALIDKKMKESYTFFILKPRLGGLFGNKKVPAQNIEQVRKAGSVIAPDGLAKAVVMNLGDSDVSTAVAAGSASVVTIAKSAAMDTIRRATNAADVLKNQSIAIKPIHGG
jgi:ribosomal protein L12E/L44/L45/RPP1/RPP2